MTEIIFEITEDEMDGGYSANALGYGIHTQGESVEEIRSNVKEAVDRLWDSRDLVRAIYRTYERLPAEIQAELPLTKVWMLVAEESPE